MAGKYEHGLDKWKIFGGDKKANKVADESAPTAAQFDELKGKLKSLREKVNRQDGNIAKLQETLHALRTNHPELWSDEDYHPQRDQSDDDDDQPEDEEANSMLVPGSDDYNAWQFRKFRRGMKSTGAKTDSAGMAAWHDKQMKKLKQGVHKCRDDTSSDSE
jgi:hypothetical protein